MLETKHEQSLTQRVLINLGCGQTRPVGWINTDSSLNSLLQSFPLIQRVLRNNSNAIVYASNNARYMNLNNPWKFASESVDVVYASHVFEHLSLSSACLLGRKRFVFLSLEV